MQGRGWWEATRNSPAGPGRTGRAWRWARKALGSRSSESGVEGEARWPGRAGCRAGSLGRPGTAPAGLGVGGDCSPPGTMWDLPFSSDFFPCPGHPGAGLRNKLKAKASRPGGWEVGEGLHPHLALLLTEDRAFYWPEVRAPVGPVPVNRGCMALAGALRGGWPLAGSVWRKSSGWWKVGPGF